VSDVLQKATGSFSEVEIEDEIVLMQLDNGEFFSLTGTARDVWKAIDGARDRAALIAELAREYDADPADLACDIDGFLAELAAARFITND
jgi:pyrroloquinoline quinone biosynthesis protein D